MFRKYEVSFPFAISPDEAQRILGPTAAALLKRSKFLSALIGKYLTRSAPYKPKRIVSAYLPAWHSVVVFDQQRAMSEKLRTYLNFRGNVCFPGVHYDLLSNLPLREPIPLSKDFQTPVPVTDDLRWQHGMNVEFMPFTRYASAMWDNSIERLRKLDPAADFGTQYMVFYPLLMPVYLATYDVVGKELSEYTLVLDARSRKARPLPLLFPPSALPTPRPLLLTYSPQTAESSIFAGAFADYAYTLQRVGRRAPSKWSRRLSPLRSYFDKPFRTLFLTDEMFAEPARKSGRREAPLEQDMRIRAWTEEEFSANLAVHKTLLHMSSGRQLLTELQTQKPPTNVLEARKHRQMIDQQAAMVRSLSTENLFPDWWKTWAKANRRRLEA
ncbi:hypothetical protein EV714DRAFT_275638 [Schizophyllum commune]